MQTTKEIKEDVDVVELDPTTFYGKSKVKYLSLNKKLKMEKIGQQKFIEYNKKLDFRSLRLPLITTYDYNPNT